MHRANVDVGRHGARSAILHEGKRVDCSLILGASTGTHRMVGPVSASVVATITLSDHPQPLEVNHFALERRNDIRPYAFK